MARAQLIHMWPTVEQMARRRQRETAEQIRRLRNRRKKARQKADPGKVARDRVRRKRAQLRRLRRP